MWLHELSAGQRRALLGLAHNVVVSDGLLDPNEEGMLDDLRRDMGLPADAATDYLELDGIERTFDGRRCRLIVVLNLLRLSYADGAFEIEEECLLQDVCRRFGLNQRDFHLLDNWVRRWLALRDEAEQLFAT